MTKKRFTVKGLCIQENSNKRIRYYLSQQGSVDSLCMRINQLFDEYKKVEKENKELKEELRIYRQVANCHNCTYQGYDWYDDGDEFEVCRKGNDVSEGICKDWEEL